MGKLKTKYIVLIGLLVLTTSAFVITKTGSKSPKEFIYNAGFRNIPEFKNFNENKERTYWKNDYALDYLAYNEADTLMKTNGFIVSTAENYIGHIPDSVQALIQKNYSRVKDKLLTYAVQPGDGFRSEVFINSEGRVDRTEPRQPYMFSNDEIGWGISSDGDRSSKCITWKRLSFYLDDDAMVAEGCPEMDDWRIDRFEQNAQIYIIAHHNLFKQGTTSDSAILSRPHINKDPLAVIKQRNGYVVLAAWE